MYPQVQKGNEADKQNDVIVRNESYSSMPMNKQQEQILRAQQLLTYYAFTSGTEVKCTTDRH